MYLKVFVLMYADDIVILDDTEEKIKNALLLLEKYCNAWKLEVDCNKTKVVIFGKGRT